MKPFFTNLKEVWSRLSWLDVVCSVIVVLGLVVELFGIHSGVFGFLEFLAVVAGIYLIVRLVGWWRSRLLWSLRNRLIVAYLLIAVVPILSIIVLVVLDRIGTTAIRDRKSTRLNSSHEWISYAVFC